VESENPAGQERGFQEAMWAHRNRRDPTEYVRQATLG